MKKRLILAVFLMAFMLLGGCAGDGGADVPVAESVKDEPEKAVLPDGEYSVDFETDSSMFRVSETCNGKGKLIVKNGEMTVHISLGSKNIVKLYQGTAEDAQKDGAELLLPTVDTVTYSDGMTEEVHGFDVPVPVLDGEFDIALVGKKGKWYDHKVHVSNPEPLDGGSGKLEDGEYSVELTFGGGSGKAKVLSPAMVKVSQGKAVAEIQWSSPSYDYMIVDGEKYLPVNTEGNSVFVIPVRVFDAPLEVAGDTVAMGKPHEIEYTLTFHSGTMKPKASLVKDGNMELEYAENFTVEYREGGYTLLTTVADGKKFLIVPEGKDVPENLGKDTVALQRPIKGIYLVASGVMDMFSGLGGLDVVAFSGQKEESWYVEDAKKAMAAGDIVYAGKYSKPDYEMLVSGGCRLAIENRMISHSPEVAEKLSGFGIPVMIEYSSYETHPLGRVEWVKFFGALLGKEDEARRIFEEQTAILDRVSSAEKTGKTVAFFFVTSNGLVQVRQSSDYISKIIELAGGKYIFENLDSGKNKASIVNMQVEEFYDGAKDADFLIYNSSIDGGVSNIDELLGKCGVLADFKAVREGNVWCTTNDMYQQSLSAGYLMEDINVMLSGGKEEGMHYLFRLE